MLNNKADAIEDYILNMFQKNQDKQVELKRTELADVISCAPSQVSYVLSTRFTNARGFKVESRRGMGGYIRIAIIEETQNEKALLFEKILNSITEETTFKDVKLFLDILLQNRIITVREAELVAQTAVKLYELDYSEVIESKVRVEILRTLFKTLINMS